MDNSNVFSIFRRWQSTPFRIEKIKIFIQYLLMTVSACVGGGAMTFFLKDQTFVSSFYRIFCHMDAPFAQCQTVPECIFLVLQYSASDFAVATSLLIFSFSVLNYLISELLLIYEGVKFGFSTVLLVRMVSSASLSKYISFFFVVLYCGISAFLLLGCFLYALKLSYASLTVKCFYTPNGRLKIPQKIGLSLLASFFKYCTWILFWNILYCIILFLRAKK